MKFAHMADVHLGAFRETPLNELNREMFKKAVDKCIEEEVDFIIISGDFFHTPMIKMIVADEVARILRKLITKDIPIYLVYGSHDYTAVGKSLIDVFHSAGMFEKVVRIENGKMKFVIDEKTGAKIAGMSGRPHALEKKYYEVIDFSDVEKEYGKKIFVFHSGIKEFLPKDLAEVDAIPLSALPKNFGYYAAGHIHRKLVVTEEKYGKIVFPGALFGSSYSDLEYASVVPQGFYIVSWEDDIKLRFVDVGAPRIVFIDVDANGKSADIVQQESIEKCKNIDVSEKIVLIKMRGELSVGKVHEIDKEKIQSDIKDMGAKIVCINKYALSHKTIEKVKVEAESREELEMKILKEHLSQHPAEFIEGDVVRFSLRLLEVLSSSTEKSDDERIMSELKEMFKIGGVKK